MNYSEYKDARDMSWRVLISQSISSLPVNVTSICESLGIFVRTFEQARTVLKLISTEDVSGRDGLSFVWNKDKWILYNSERAEARIRFTIAHELGHCLLHHARNGSMNSIIYNNSSGYKGIIEQQANKFAADLLSPICVLMGLGVTSAEEVANICGISIEAGQIRLNRLNNLMRRNDELKKQRGYGCFLRSPLERRVYEQFKDFIANNRH